MARAGNGNEETVHSDFWNLRLYISGETPRSLAAFERLRRICEQYLAGKYSIRVIDIRKNPQLAGRDQIIATPTVIKDQPEPARKIVGDFSNTERVLVGLGLGVSSIADGRGVSVGCERRY